MSLGRIAVCDGPVWVTGCEASRLQPPPRVVIAVHRCREVPSRSASRCGVNDACWFVDGPDEVLPPERDLIRYVNLKDVVIKQGIAWHERPLYRIDLRSVDGWSLGVES